MELVDFGPPQRIRVRDAVVCVASGALLLAALAVAVFVPEPGPGGRGPADGYSEATDSSTPPSTIHPQAEP